MGGTYIFGRVSALVLVLSSMPLAAQLLPAGLTSIVCSNGNGASSTTSSNTVTFAGLTCTVTIPSPAVAAPAPVVTTPVAVTSPLVPIQSAGNGGSGVASTTVAINATPGNTLFAVVSYFDNDALTLPAGWTPAKVGFAAGPASCPTQNYDHLAVCLLSRVVAAGDPTSYTFSQSGSDGMAALLMEVPGANKGIAINGLNGGTGGGGTVKGFPVTPTVLGTLPIMCVSPSSPTVPVAPSGWVLDRNVDTSNYHSLFCLHRSSLTTDTTTPIVINVPTSTSGGFSTSMTFLVAPAPSSPNPVASAAGPYFPSATIPVVFDGSGSNDPSAESLAYAWTFGDGTTATGVTPLHTYAKPGSYTAALTVTNKDGLTGSITTPVTVQVSPAVTGLGLNAPLNGWVPNPGGAAHVDVSAWPVDPNSAGIIANLGTSTPHADFGSSKYGLAGIPYSIAPAATPRVAWTDTNLALAPGTTLANSLSDDAVMPFYIGMPIEGNPADNVLVGGGDQHSLTLTQDGVDYESWHTVYCSTCSPNFRADQATIWDLTQDEKRSYTTTSADAAGLPILPFLYRYDEVLAGAFNHAFRFTEDRFGCEYANGHGYGTFVEPATHSACTGMSQNYMGMRMRLKPGYTSGTCTSAIDQMFLTAMKKYGGIAADRGGNMYISGTPDDRWPDDDILGCLQTIDVSNFEIVKDPASTIYSGARYPAGPPPVVNSFTASSVTVGAGQPVTLSWDVSGASYIFIDKVGLVRGNTGSVVVTPTATTNYSILATNRFLSNDDGTGDGERVTASATVIVSRY